ncbi:unnamed protein product, partial [Gordionus sp. m RMFG-2023]
MLTCLLIKHDLLSLNTLHSNFVRYVSTVMKNKRKKTKGKIKGPYVNENDIVVAGQIITKQNNLLFHPGLNVIIGKNNTLNSVINGKIIVSAEKLFLDNTRYK